MAKKKHSHYSGIGGQAVLEGVMMKNKEKYAVAIRKPNGEIEVELENHQGVGGNSVFKNLPFIRGIFNFVDSMVLGTRCLNFSAEFYEDEEEQETKFDKFLNKITGGKAEKVLSAFVVAFSVILAVAIFVVLPYFITSLFKAYVRSSILMTIIEGCIRILIFLLYVVGISAMKDIKRLYMYHGAEHKCINCIEHGMELNVENVLKSSKEHKRCGTSFLLIVMCISIVFFMFIRVDSPVLRLVLRLLLVPVIAGVSYEVLRFAGNSDSKFMDIVSKPGLWLQHLTTSEPDASMVEVAIASVEAVFDWRTYIQNLKDGN